MLQKYLKDIKFRKNFSKFEKKKLNNKIVFIKSINYTKDLNRKHSLSLLLKGKINRYSKTKINYRCRLTNRGRGSVRKFGISRILLRNMLSQGIIPNYRKSTW